MLRAILVLSGVSLVATGCTSISSTLLNRTDNDVFVGNSNGEPNAHCGARPFKGVPITIRVPTHLDVAIKEKLYLRKNKDDKLVRVYTRNRSLYVEPVVIETDKVFTVDPKRPAAGTLASTIEWNTDKTADGGEDNSQYFASIVNNIKDETILDVTAALNTVLPTLNTIAARTANDGQQTASTLKDELIVESRTVAWKRFDLDSYCFEQEVADFVSQHMNCCNTCQRNTNYDARGFPPESGIGASFGNGSTDGDQQETAQPVPMNSGEGREQSTGSGEETTSARLAPMFLQPPFQPNVR